MCFTLSLGCVFLSGEMTNHGQIHKIKKRRGGEKEKYYEDWEDTSTDDQTDLGLDLIRDER